MQCCGLECFQVLITVRTSVLLQDLMQVDAFHCQLGKRNLSNDVLVIQWTEANTGVEMHFLAPNVDLR